MTFYWKRDWTNEWTNDMNDSSRRTDRRELNLDIKRWNPPLVLTHLENKNSYMRVLFVHFCSALDTISPMMLFCVQNSAIGLPHKQTPQTVWIDSHTSSTLVLPGVVCSATPCFHCAPMTTPPSSSSAFYFDRDVQIRQHLNGFRTQQPRHHNQNMSQNPSLLHTKYRCTLQNQDKNNDA